MPTTRAKKKARTNQGKYAALAKSPKTTGDGSSDNNPQLNSELIARVGTYVPLFKSGAVIKNEIREPYTYADVFNLCLAVGPVNSRLIKQSYLKKNLHYLELCQRRMVPSIRRGSGGPQWIRQCYLAWMSANADWRDYVSDGVIDECKYASLPNGEIPSITSDNYKKHPLSGLANPALAVQLGLIDALRFLVEDKCIDVNAKRWRTYYLRDRPVHLLTVAINEKQPEAFNYLLSLDAIDFNNDCTVYDRDHSKSIFGSALEAYVENETKGQYFRALVKHPLFQPNERFLYGYNPDRREPGKMTLLHMFVNEYTNMLMMHGKPEVLDPKESRFLHAFSLVLDAGADPKLEFDDLSSPFAIATDNLRAAACGGITFGQRLVDTLRKMISMMSRQVRK